MTVVKSSRKSSTQRWTIQKRQKSLMVVWPLGLASSETA